MSKSEVYSWRLSAESKAALEAEARRLRIPLSVLLERITSAWLAGGRRAGSGEDAEQAHLQAAAAAAIGAIRGGDPLRSEKARESVRRRVRESRGR